MGAPPPVLALRVAVPDDVELVAALKERVLRRDLEPLVGWDPDRSRARVVEHDDGIDIWMRRHPGGVDQSDATPRHSP